MVAALWSGRAARSPCQVPGAQTIGTGRDRTGMGSGPYGTPWPLSETYFLANKNNTIILLDKNCVIADEQRFVKAIRCIRMELGAPDDSGRRRPVPVKDSEFNIDCDVVIIAIGNNPNPLIAQTTPDIKVSIHKSYFNWWIYHYLS
jgi:hypothetical protein